MSRKGNQKYFENEDTAYQDLWYATKVIFRIIPNTKHIKKHRSQINDIFL